jgi:dTDP-4-dehydrorhamnose reductase
MGSTVRVLILGGSGMIGHRLWLACRDRFDTTVTLRGPLSGQPWAALFDPQRVVEGVDLTDDAALAALLRHTRPHAVVNAAGLVKQRPTGQDAIAAITANALLPHRLAALCLQGGIRLLHLSTDCVFSGHAGAYRESDTADPVDTYGRTKLLGEVTGPGQLTIRKSAIGRELSGQRGLLEWFLANRGGHVRGFTSAIFSGLTTAAIAATIVAILDEHSSLEGLWHVAGPAISKFDLLAALRDGLGVSVAITPDDTTAIDRSLDDHRFRAATGIIRPSWESMIAALAADPLRYDTVRGSPC